MISFQWNGWEFWLIDDGPGCFYSDCIRLFWEVPEGLMIQYGYGQSRLEAIIHALIAVCYRPVAAIPHLTAGEYSDRATRAAVADAALSPDH